MTNIVLMGTPDFSVPVLNRLIEEGYNVSLVVTQPDRPKGRKKILTPPPLKEAAVEAGIPVLQPEKIKKEYQQVLEYEPDLIITAAYGQILPKALLDYPKFGAINVHASLLPEYRGAAPIHYALMDGKKETGITIMYMVPELDAGDILSAKSVAVEEEDDVGTLHDKLAQTGAELLAETLPLLVNGTIKAEEQDASKATFAPTIKRGEELVDFSLPRDKVWGHIRGMSPWPVAYTYWNGKPLKLWGARKSGHSGDQAPGTVADKTKEGITVVCGDGNSIVITELQPSGKKRMDGASFINGIGQGLEIGEVLGEKNE